METLNPKGLSGRVSVKCFLRVSTGGGGGVINISVPRRKGAFHRQ